MARPDAQPFEDTGPREDREPESTARFSVRGRLIPAFTIIVIVGLLSLLAYALFYNPHKSAVEGPGRINTNGTLVVLGNSPAPDFALTSFSGKPISLDQFRGKTILVNFWASWCPPCQDEAPILAELERAQDPSQFVVLGIDVWDQDADANAFLQQHGLTYLNGADKNGTIAIDYGVSGVPETFFISPDGKLLGKFPGPLQSVQQVNRLLQQLSAKS